MMLNFMELNRAFPKIGTLCFYLALASAAYLSVRGVKVTSDMLMGEVNGTEVIDGDKTVLHTLDKLAIKLLPASVFVLCIFWLRK